MSKMTRSEILRVIVGICLIPLAFVVCGMVRGGALGLGLLTIILLIGAGLIGSVFLSIRNRTEEEYDRAATAVAK